MAKNAFLVARIILIIGCVLAPKASAQKSPPTSKLAGKELAGKKLFLQRCSVCHMPPLNEQDDPKSQPYGPKLNGYVKDAATEERVRQAIRNGTPRMPGFQYGLTAEEIENIVAYLKIFK